MVLSIIVAGQIEFEEFCTLAARFLVEEDAEAMQQELKEAFRLYDKEGNTTYHSFHSIFYSFQNIFFLLQVTATLRQLFCVKF